MYNMLKSARSSRPVFAAALLNQVATSDKQLEGNLPTVLRSVRGTKQFWFVKRSELRCMIREYGTPTLFLTFSYAKYESLDITGYLRKVNNVPSSYSIGKLCAEDPLSMLRKFLSSFTLFLTWSSAKLACWVRWSISIGRKSTRHVVLHTITRCCGYMVHPSLAETNRSVF